MAPISIPTAVTPVDNQLILAAWILGGTGIYLVVVTLIIIIRQCFVSRGFCAECNCCGKPNDEDSCSAGCYECAQSCNCSTPNLTACCDSMCGPRKRCDVDDCFFCCSGQGGCCQMPSTPECCDCPTVDFEGPECDEIVCCCIRISVMSSAPT